MSGYHQILVSEVFFPIFSVSREEDSLAGKAINLFEGQEERAGRGGHLLVYRTDFLVAIFRLTF